MVKAFRYQDFVDGQRAGRNHGVLIDDSGSPGVGYTESSERATMLRPRSLVRHVLQEPIERELSS